MQFLSQVDPAKAAQQHVAFRTKAIAQTGPELPPKELLALLNAGASATSGASEPTGTVKAGADLAPTDNDTSAVARYAPIVIGLLAANLLVGLVLLVLGVFGCVRRGTAEEGKMGAKATHYVPVKLKEDAGQPEGYRDAEGTAYDTPYRKSLS